MNEPLRPTLDHEPLWLDTNQAAKYLNIDPQTLKRKREDRKEGFLILGIHYRYGAGRTSPIQWEVNVITQEFNYRGLLYRQNKKAPEFVGA